METGQPEMVDAGQDDQKVVIPVAPRAVDVAGGQQQRGIKRTRRDRGSTAKERISKMPPCAAGKRSSIYRGVTRHRWTGRYEAHLWDKSTWNQSQNKKGKQVYLGAYDEEEAAARAYDLAALRYWGPGTLINFPLTDYARDVEEMQNVTREEYLASLRRKSSGFSRGVSKYRGVARHHHNGRWEARIGRVFGNKYLYLGTYGTQEEAAAAYDMAAIEYRGLNAVTNFDLSRYIRWLRPGQNNSTYPETETTLSPSVGVAGGDDSQLTEEAHGGQGENQQHHSVWSTQSTGPYYRGLGPVTTQDHSSASPSALSLLLQSSMFKQMMERAAASTENESNSADPSEVSNQIEQQHNHDHQQIDSSNANNRLNYPAWGKQGSQQQHTGSLVDEEEGVVHLNKHEDSTHYHQSVISNYEGVVGHYAELGDQKQQQAAQRYQKLHRQQHQVDHLAAATVYGHGAYSGSHGPVSSLYSTEQESGAASASLEDGNWTFPDVFPLSSIISTSLKMYASVDLKAKGEPTNHHHQSVGNNA